MVSQQVLKGNWNEISGKIHSKWGQLSNDEMQQYKGDVTQLVGYIQRKTGEAKDRIESFLNNLGDDAEGLLGKASSAASHMASQAYETAKGGAQAVADTAVSGYHAAERIVQERPAISVAAAFGCGILTGICLTLLLRSDR